MGMAVVKVRLGSMGIVGQGIGELGESGNQGMRESGNQGIRESGNQGIGARGSRGMSQFVCRLQSGVAMCLRWECEVFATRM